MRLHLQYSIKQPNMARYFVKISLRPEGFQAAIHHDPPLLLQVSIKIPDLSSVKLLEE